MMTSKKRAICSLAVALTFVATAAFAQAQSPAQQPQADEAAAPSTISKTPPSASSQNVQSAVAHAVDNTAPNPAVTNQLPSAVSSTAAALANHETADLSALHDPTLHAKLNDVLKKLTPERQRLNKEYEEAAALFPSFCQDWDRKLHDREVNNLAHLIWKFENGLETALYTGYSHIESCETHQSPQGFSIGKITYEEYRYKISGKTEEEAKHTHATPVDDTHTTEIFRWEKGKWFY